MGETEDKAEHMQTPTFEWKWNLNTIVVLTGFAAGFVTWGYTVAELKGTVATTETGMNRVSGRVSALEQSSRTLDNHELRITAVERRVDSSDASARATDATLNALGTDIRVMKEILQRIEATQTGRVQR